MSLPCQSTTCARKEWCASATLVSTGLSKLNSLSTETKTHVAEFVSSVDLDEVAHDEPPHLDLHCLPSSLQILNMI